jgi:hypothetical protein
MAWDPLPDEKSQEIDAIGYYHALAAMKNLFEKIVRIGRRG